MSSYISFYLKSKKEEYLPLGSFSRNHHIYQAGDDYVPYGKAIPLTRTIIEEIISDIEQQNNSYHATIKKEQEAIQFLKEVNGTLEEKEELFYEHQYNIGDLRDYIEENKIALGYYNSLLYIIEEAEDTKYYSDKERLIDATQYIYAGIECGNPQYSSED